MHEISIEVSITIDGTVATRKNATTRADADANRVAESLLDGLSSDAANDLRDARINAQAAARGVALPARPGPRVIGLRASSPARVPVRQRDTLLGSFVDYAYAHPILIGGHVLLAVLVVLAALSVVDAATATVRH